MNEVKYHDYLDELKPYHGGALCCEGAAMRLCFNEGAFGANPKVMEAARHAALNMHAYPDMGCTKLREALGKKYHLDPQRIVCGAGSDDLITLLVRAFVSRGEEVLTNAYAFAMYAIAARTVGGVPVIAGGDVARIDLNAVLAAITDKTRVVFLANPNNPTGSWLPRDEIAAFIRNLPANVLFVYDAAYADYMVDPNYSDGFEWAKDKPNVFVLRTFSKIHGLGGMRVGWGYGAKRVADVLNRVRNAFCVSAMAEVAAIESLKDDAFVTAVRDHTLLWRDKLAAKLKAVGAEPLPSVCNFVLVKFRDADQAHRLFEYLKSINILVRPMGGYQLPDYLRITIGREDEMNALFTAFDNFPDFKKA